MAPVSAPPHGIVVRRISAGRGLRWWADSAAWLFRDLARLGIWIAMTLTALLILAPFNWFAGIGSIAATLLLFVLAGGFMHAARATEQGGTPRFGDLFAGFGPQGGALVGAGLILVAACVAVVGLMLAIGLGTVVAAVWQSPGDGFAAAAAIGDMGIGVTSLLLLLGCLLLFVPISMAAWLAPALVMLRAIPPMQALRLSLAACARNAGALSVYGLAGTFLAGLATIPFMLGWFVFLPMITLSTYAAYCDLFDAPVEVLDAQPEPFDLHL